MKDDTISRAMAIDLLVADKISDNNKRIILAINMSDERAIDTLNMTCDRHAQMIKDMPSAQSEYEPVKAEDFAKMMSENTIYNFMSWHNEALELMNRYGFVICRRSAQI